MTKFLIELMQVAIFIFFYFRESSSFSIKGNHRINSRSIGRSIIRTPLNTPLNSVREFRLRALSLGFENDSEKHQESMKQCTAWSSIFNPLSSSVQNENTDMTAVDMLRVATFMGCTTTAILIMVFNLAPGCWRFFLAGGLCAAISHTIPTPVDVVKTRKQVDPRLMDHSFLEASRYIIKEDGFRALWAGLGPTTFGYLLEGTIKFGVYEVLKPAIKQCVSKIASTSPLLMFVNSQFVTFVLSGVFSGLAASFVLCPMEVIRIRLVAESNYATLGWIRGGFKILKQEGSKGFTKGLNPMILKQVPYTVTKNVSFDLFTKFFYSTLRERGVVTASHAIKFIIPLVSAAIASVLSTITSQPGDTILSLSCAHDGDHKTRDISRNILYSNRGISGFFVGTRTRLLHVGIIVTIQLLIYDYVKRLCGIAATGLQ